MNDQVFKSLEILLANALKDKHGIEGQALGQLVLKGKQALKDTMLSHVMKHGTKEAEDVICSRIAVHGSTIHVKAREVLEKSLKDAPELGGQDSGSVAETAVDTLMNGLRQQFDLSGYSKDTDGVCKFLGIDPMVLKMVNSNVGKFFGKFRK